MKQSETAATVYREDIQPTLKQRQLFVRNCLRAFIEYHRVPPTGLELVEFIRRERPDLFVDVNTVRPRITEMEAIGYVKRGEKRRCQVSAKRVNTWVLSEPVEAGPVPVEQSLF